MHWLSTIEAFRRGFCKAILNIKQTESTDLEIKLKIDLFIEIAFNFETS